MSTFVKRLVVGISGASGIIYGVRLLQVLKMSNVETHLVITRAAEKVMEVEGELSLIQIRKLSTRFYSVNDVAAPISSGSFLTDGMVVIPCSTKTLAGIANGFSDNLLLRAADVTVKERRPLILVVRETPLSTIHLRNMLKLANIGVTILPASPAFYHKPTTVNDLVDHIVGKVLDILNIKHELYERWKPECKVFSHK